MTKRTKIAKPEPSRQSLGFDLSDFKPDLAPRPKPDRAAVIEAAEAVGFVSREPQPSKPTATPRRGRRTGRNAQISIKLRPDTIAEFYAYCDRHEAALGETFEQMLALLIAADSA